jgi:hypothetical protein
MQYTQDSTKPIHEPVLCCNDPGQQIVWANAIAPYIKSGTVWGERGVYACPSPPSTKPELSLVV